MGASDTDLLRDYAQGSEAAFAALVTRHLNLVYSAARRQVRSPQLAEEVAQSVFCDLARQATRFPRGTALNGWLYLVTRRTAIDAVRRESRRLAHEQAAAEISFMHSTPSAWSRVEPVLDEAMAALSASDRSALLLRFFENKPLREIGAALGTSEDAAQKRVSRAVEQLRALLVRRGIAVTGAALAADLSAHAIQTAPAGLGMTISIAAVLSGTAGSVATLEATKVITMTTTTKTLLALTLVAVLGGTLYEVNAFARQQSDLAAVQQHAADLSAELSRTRAQQLAAAGRLKAVETEIDARLAKPAIPAAGSEGAIEVQMRAWLANLDQLKQLLQQRPGLAIPELRFVSDETWFSVAAGAKLDSDASIREALAVLRGGAENTMAQKLSQALGAYIRSTGGTLPDRVTQLLPFFDPPIDPFLLDRYTMLQTGKLGDVPSGQRMEIVAAKAPVDVEYDSYWRIGTSGYGSQNALSYDVSQARRAFTQAHDGQKATTATELTPFLKWPVEEAALQKFLNPRPASGTP